MKRQHDDVVIELYRDGFPDFARMVKRMGGTLEEAKDSFQDAFLIYLEKEKAGKLLLRSSPKAYLIGTAKICWLHSRNKETVLSLPDDFEIDQSDDREQAEREIRLLESLQKSGQHCLELLKAFYYDHCSMDRIAGMFGFSGRRSATVQKYKCLEKVRKEMQKINVYAQ